MNTNNHYNPLDLLLSKLEKLKRTGSNKYIACCPSHDDVSPSLAIREDHGRLLLHCFAGCDTEAVLASVGLTFSDIMPNESKGNFKKIKKPFTAMEGLYVLKFETMLAYLYASDMAKGLILAPSDKERLLLAVSRINHVYEVTKNGL